MGVEPPFLYDAVKKDTTRYSYKEFDPKAVSRASMQSQPPKPKKDGPLVSFNKHPEYVPNSETLKLWPNCFEADIPTQFLPDNAFWKGYRCKSERVYEGSHYRNSYGCIVFQNISTTRRTWSPDYYGSNYWRRLSNGMDYENSGE